MDFRSAIFGVQALMISASACIAAAWIYIDDCIRVLWQPGQRWDDALCTSANENGSRTDFPLHHGGFPGKFAYSWNESAHRAVFRARPWRVW
jgi:hypothetical protein